LLSSVNVTGSPLSYYLRLAGVVVWVPAVRQPSMSEAAARALENRDLSDADYDTLLGLDDSRHASLPHFLLQTLPAPGELELGIWMAELGEWIAAQAAHLSTWCCIQKLCMNRFPWPCALFK
jgi:hypothetical protein